MEYTYLHRREGIILTAVEIIGELGIQGLSTREIARRQNISEGTLFRHYKNKNEIMTAVLDYYSKYDLDIFESVRMKNLKPRDSITYLIKSFSEYYENYPSITAITHIYEVFSKDAELADKVKGIFNSRADYLKGIIKEAQKSGEIIQDIDEEMLADMILGFVRETILRWRLSEYNFALKDRVLSTLDTILCAFTPKKS